MDPDDRPASLLTDDADTLDEILEFADVMIAALQLLRRKAEDALLHTGDFDTYAAWRAKSDECRDAIATLQAAALAR